jgi:NAD(P)-dependent dehydrogenase (short-subunit alcohol dehydrogenase family)
VSDAAAVDALATATMEAYEAVHLVCNNAGVGAGGPMADVPLAEWEWVLGVNLWGVIHGVRSFLPLLRLQDEAHIVNTASVAGLLSPPGMGIYCVSKHAVVTLTECLHHDLASRSDKVRASLLCPAYVPTGIHDSERNRPEELRNAAQDKSEQELAREAALRHAVQSGRISAEQVADTVFDAVRDERFYILTHQKIKGAIETRMMDMLLERPPTDTSRPRK